MEVDKTPRHEDKPQSPKVEANIPVDFCFALTFSAAQNPISP
jgi:hypothetical protein